MRGQESLHFLEQQDFTTEWRSRRSRHSTGRRWRPKHKQADPFCRERIGHLSERTLDALADNDLRAAASDDAMFEKAKSLIREPFAPSQRRCAAGHASVCRVTQPRLS